MTTTDPYVLVPVLLVALLAGGLLVGGVVFLVIEHRQVSSTVQTRGVVTRSGIARDIESADVGPNLYTLDLEYTYEVGGTTYTGHGRQHTEGRTSDLRAAEALAARYPVGGEVVVHYDPDDPAKAVLETGHTSVPIILTLVGAVLSVAAGILVWKVILR
jgi:hypothetical protein